MFIIRSLRVSLAISLLSCSSIALSQPERQPAADGQADAEEVVEDENVIVVEGQRIHSEATELAADLAEYGTQVQLITDDEIKTGGFTNFGELAAGLIRGANIGYSPDEGEFTIRIDGGTDRDTLLMVDGVPYFDRSSPSEDLWPATAIDPRMIASVEIFRGGQSLYFGSNGGLGVVSVRSKEPRRELGGEIGVYGGSFRTREIYGNVSVPLPLGDGAGEHSIMLFGRSYETDSNILFDREAFADTLLELGGFREYPYSYNNLGARYRWIINPDTEFGAGFQLATIDFEDTFPNSSPYAPNKTEFPIFNASFRSELTDRMRLEVEGHYQAPSLLNTELDPLVCSIPRVQDLPSNIRAQAPARGFATAAEFEAFAAANGIPAGCVTNPQFNFGRANVQARTGIYVNPANGKPYGTLDNPFPIGNPMGFVIQSVADFGTGVPVKGIGDVDQFRSGYVDYGINARLYYRWADWLETVLGAQNTSYRDNSDPVFGVRDVTLTSNGIYGDLRFDLPLFEGLNVSLAGRQDFNTSFADQSSWRFGARQGLPGGFYVRAAGGTSYSLPKIDEIGAFGPTANLNPGLNPQTVKTFNVGAGINGEFSGGTFNVELGYFDTEITNLFSSRAVEGGMPRICPRGATRRAIHPRRDRAQPPAHHPAGRLLRHRRGRRSSGEPVSRGQSALAPGHPRLYGRSRAGHRACPVRHHLYQERFARAEPGLQPSGAARRHHRQSGVRGARAGRRERTAPIDRASRMVLVGSVHVHAQRAMGVRAQPPLSRARMGLCARLRGAARRCQWGAGGSRREFRKLLRAERLGPVFPGRKPGAPVHDPRRQLAR